MVTRAMQQKRHTKEYREQRKLNVNKHGVSDELTLEQLQESIQKCDKCDLSVFDVNKKETGFGTGKLFINHKHSTMFKQTLFFVGLCPSVRRFDEECRAFEGHEDVEVSHMKTSGGIFDKALDDSGIIEYNVYISNILRCSTLNNITPSQTQISSCIDWLKKEIELIQPRKIIAMGNDVYDILKKELDKDVEKIFHPAYVLRSKDKYFELVEQLRRLK